MVPLMGDGWVMNFQTFLLCFPEKPGLGMWNGMPQHEELELS